ncbi:hypothetical protein AX774_g3981 [Zancudomyces culisetae]|uniref:Uncharacterized protein n=1 Tax=Zancudomyces culisetae TaxID=1213189 RepID=A0A1R1PID3_ZANCU|nr:hypothetical protein AX774_g5845 [Zancudomyces culisetae]OMH82540.1 hypothetical protein AX774_g3981 [Zancudomyces culisetae]|eukprot:OMH80717.1 hypothetical protein AX774_g5845 [Zancudomyces culisetae]
MLLTVLFSVLSLILFLAAGLQSELCNDTRCSRFGYPGLRVSENGLAYKWELSNSTLSCTVRGGNTKYYATLSRELYGMPDGSNTGSYVCNKCVYIKGYKAVIMAKVLGYCDSCSGGDIGLSTDAFKLVSGGNDIDMVPVVWRPCTN